MKRKLTVIFGAALLSLSAVGLTACCGGGGDNSAKTAECKDKANADECKECCGGNYSYLGEGSCTCY